MNQESIPTRPPNPGEILLRNKFYEFFATQDESMGKLTRQLLTDSTRYQLISAL
jgi:hypothetical protein